MVFIYSLHLLPPIEQQIARCRCEGADAGRRLRRLLAVYAATFSVGCEAALGVRLQRIGCKPGLATMDCNLVFLVSVLVVVDAGDSARRRRQPVV